MSNVNCKIIGDLLPLYIDEVCSEESHVLVEKHLKECEACRNTLEQMNSPVEVKVPEGSEFYSNDPKRALKRIKKILRRKYIIIILCAALVCILWTGASLALQCVETPIDYEDIKVSVIQDKEDSKQYNLTFNGPQYACLYGESVVIAEDESNRYEIEVIHCTSSPWTRLFQQKPFEDFIAGSYRDDPDYTTGSYMTEDKGRRQYMRTVAVYYQATPGSERHLLWEAQWYKEKLKKEKEAKKEKK